MRSVESALGFRDEEDANILYRYLLERISVSKTEEATRLLRVLLDHMLADKRWILSQRKELADAKAYISEIGRTVKAAGLRSYKDEKGRIFIAHLDGAGDEP